MDQPATTYRIMHSTTYSYQQAVRVCHNLVMLTPRSDWAATLEQHRLAIKPTPIAIRRHEDYFGNLVHSFSVEESHRQLSVTSTGRIRVAYPSPRLKDVQEPWEIVSGAVQSQKDPRWLEATQFRFDSTRIKTNLDFENYARQSFVAKRPIVDAAIELTERIFDDFKYDGTVTNVHTTPEEAFELRSGVCQDFAHVQIACLRSLGLCARYVSGYLRTEPLPGQEKLIGSDQSHAWLSLYCGQRLGWIDLDPTNNKPCDNDHIPVAWGRDYNDVVPVRGVFLGGGQHHIKVSVDVSPISSEDQ